MDCYNVHFLILYCLFRLFGVCWFDGWVGSLGYYANWFVVLLICLYLRAVDLFVVYVCVWRICLLGYLIVVLGVWLVIVPCCVVAGLLIVLL